MNNFVFVLWTIILLFLSFFYDLAYFGFHVAFQVNSKTWYETELPRYTYILAVETIAFYVWCV